MHRKLVLGLAAVLVSGGLIAAGGQSANAASVNGVCEPNEVCLYPLPNFSGSVADLPAMDIEDYTDWNFVGPGAYAGYGLNDFSMSLRNRQSYWKVVACKGSWFRGPCITIGGGGTRSDLGDLNNALSSDFVTPVW